MIDFPNSPTVGQVFTVAGVSWTWDGVKWALSPSVFVSGINDNRIINGDMRIDQRNNGASGTAAGYTIDRWYYGATQASKGTWVRGNAGASLVALGFGYCLAFTSSSAYAVTASDHFELRQPIEADLISDFAFGTAGAQPITLSFWVLSSLTGAFGGALSNAQGSGYRAYPFTYSIPVANTWTRITITIPGDTAGTWVMSGNAQGAMLFFDLGSGATYRAPAGAWASGNYTGANGAASVVGTNGAVWQFTGVKLEIGSVATPFNRQSLAKSLADCQRYYQVGQTINNSYVGGVSAVYAGYNLPVSMRTAPTLVPTATTMTNATAIAAGAYNPTSIYASASATAAGVVVWGCTYTASAEL